MIRKRSTLPYLLGAMSTFSASTQSGIIASKVKVLGQAVNGMFMGNSSTDSILLSFERELVLRAQVLQRPAVSICLVKLCTTAVRGTNVTRPRKKGW